MYPINYIKQVFNLWRDNALVSINIHPLVNAERQMKMDLFISDIFKGKNTFHKIKNAIYHIYNSTNTNVSINDTSSNKIWIT